MVSGSGGLVWVDEQAFSPIDALADVQFDRVLTRLALAVKQASPSPSHTGNRRRRAGVGGDARLQLVAPRDLVQNGAGVCVLALQPCLETGRPAVLHPAVVVGDLRSEIVVHHRLSGGDRRRGLRVRDAGDDQGEGGDKDAFHDRTDSRLRRQINDKPEECDPVSCPSAPRPSCQPLVRRR